MHCHSLLLLVLFSSEDNAENALPSKESQQVDENSYLYLKTFEVFEHNSNAASEEVYQEIEPEVENTGEDGTILEEEQTPEETDKTDEKQEQEVAGKILK